MSVCPYIIYIYIYIYVYIYIYILYTHTVAYIHRCHLCATVYQCVYVCTGIRMYDIVPWHAHTISATFYLKTLSWSTVRWPIFSFFQSPQCHDGHSVLAGVVMKCLRRLSVRVFLTVALPWVRPQIRLWLPGALVVSYGFPMIVLLTWISDYFWP
jgi:hypothetical protein